MQFIPYPKTPRLKRDVVITEKIDGTNAQIVISLSGALDHVDGHVTAMDGPLGLTMRVGSRSRWITPGKATDNFGFAAWCLENATELFKLGIGQHFGEWYGKGIQRGYGLDHRRFALFNTARWGDHNPGTPKCCEVVPVLSFGLSREVMQSPDAQVGALARHGSVAVPGWPTPEGVIVYHSASKQNYKVLIENDEVPKALAGLGPLDRLILRGYSEADLDASNPYTQGITAT